MTSRNKILIVALNIGGIMLALRYFDGSKVAGQYFDGSWVALRYFDIRSGPILELE